MNPTRRRGMLAFFRRDVRESLSTRYGLPVSSRTLVYVLVLSVVYAVAGRFGQLIAIPPGNVTAVWFPAGVAVAALLLYGYRLWPGVWLGSVLVNTWAFFDSASSSGIMGSLLEGTIIGAGAASQAVVGAFLCRAVTDSRGQFEKARNVFQFAVLAGAISCLISATVGATSLVLGGFLDWGDYGLTWLTWWLGDTTGVIVAGPLLLTWHLNFHRGWSARRNAELSLMMVLVVVVGLVAFGAEFNGFHGRLAWTYATMALLLWPAVRFGQRETMLAAFVLTVVATLCYKRYVDSVAPGGAYEIVLALQGFIGIATVTSLSLAADIAHHARIAANLKKYKTASLGAADHWMITDVRGIILEVNPSFSDLTGYSQAELVGVKANVLKSGVHDRPFYDEMWRTIRAGKPYRGVVVNRKKNGELFHELKTITPIRNAAGRIDRFLSIGKDITEIVHKEQELIKTARDLERVNRQLLASDQALMRQVTILESVFASMKEGVVVADKEGRFVMVNEAAERMAGIGATETSPDEWVATYGVYRTDNETPFPTSELPLVRAIAGETTENVEMIVRNPEKTEGEWLRVSGCPILDEGGEVGGGLIVMRELTNEKRAEKAEHELQITRAEFEIARRIQQRLLPNSAPELAGFDIAGASKSAAATGGDYFDFVTMPDGTLLVLVGDVSGHGLGPALLMASVRGHLRALVQTGLPPAEAVRIANGLIQSETDSESFVTLFAAHFDPKSASFDYISAGHTTAYVLGQDCVVKEAMESSFPPLGVLPELSAAARPVQITSGDTVLILTDGIVEAQREDGSFYGQERAIEVVRSNGYKTGKDIVGALFDDVNEWCGCPVFFEDDGTVVVVRRV